MTYPGSGGQYPPGQQPGPPPGQGPQRQRWPGLQPEPPPGAPRQQGGYQPGGAYPASGPQQFGGYQTNGPGPYAGQPPFGGEYGGYPPPRRSRKGVIIGVVIAIVVLVGGGGVTWWALSRTANSSGASNPQDAAITLVSDIGNGDVLGLANGLAPAESAVLQQYVDNGVNQLKRLQVIKPDADPHRLTAGQATVQGLQFDSAAAERINDHLTINKLVSGTITLNSNLIGSVFTDQFVRAISDGELPPPNQTDTINIADEVRKSGEPIRIATVNVDGKWYPSVFYTIADYALHSAHQNWPTQSIPANGANSADDAVKRFSQALLDADYRTAIELTSPDEMGALHDAGQALLDDVPNPQPTGVRIDKVTFNDQPSSGGTEAVVQSVTVDDQGQQVSVAKDGNCYTMTNQADGENQRLCASDLSKLISSDNPDSAEARLADHVVAGLMGTGLGVVAKQVDGKWYVSPVRTITQLSQTFLSSLQPDDIKNIFPSGG